MFLFYPEVCKIKDFQDKPAMVEIINCFNT